LSIYRTGGILLIGILISTLAILGVTHKSEAAETVKPLGWNWVCTTAGRDYVDPIVFPGVKPTGHLHDFMGVLVNENTTNALKLRKLDNNCRFAHNSTEEGDQSAYWEPVPYNRNTGEAIKTVQVNNYYRVAPGIKPSEVKTPPSGLRYVIGDPNAIGGQDHIKWRCTVSKTGQPTPVDCTEYNTNVKISYILPSCSNGQKDSPDHKSHLVYPDKRTGCPASHPREIPSLNMSFGIRIQDGRDVVFKGHHDEEIAPHADFFNGTTQEVWRHWIDTCIQDPRGGCFGTGIPGKRNPV